MSGSQAPTVEDAKRVLCNASLRAMGRAVEDGLAQMRGVEVVNCLVQAGCEDRDAARALVAEALRELGGENRSRSQRWGTGGRREMWLEDFWVHVSAIEDPA